ncbi:hypothetical protein L2E82_45086 [Cichorium intybus]|uniref:Uncharacterized protein n=1 Tax=Cichorium intybus TaxID=13427 RepID=A0ACB8ZSJ6_CICIN|nr:hypothetical protein L2E82_45086 [Cichorium intybus]
MEALLEAVAAVQAAGDAVADERRRGGRRWSSWSTFAIDRKRDRAVRTGRPEGGRNEETTTAADDRRPGEDGSTALAAVDVAGGHGKHYSVCLKKTTLSLLIF